MKESLQPIITKLEEMFHVFNLKFFDGKLVEPVITVNADTTGGAYGWISTWKAWKKEGSEDGFYEINITAEYLSRPFAQTCSTLLHEMCHLWNIQNDIKDTSRGGSYHNKTFKKTAEEHGLIIEKDDKYGWTKTSLNEDTKEFIGITWDSAQFELHRTGGVRSETKGGSKKSNSRKYVCPVCGIIVRATKEVHVLCIECDQELELEEGDED